MITKLYNNIIRFIFGIDIFISYSRKDTAVYAERLAIILQENKFKCYLDKWGTQPGQDLSFSLKRILRHSSLFVVLGSDKAGESNSVYKEVEEFRKANRTIVPIDFGNIRNAKWYSILQGLALTEEDAKRQSTGEPSYLVIKRITNSFTYQRQSQRLRRVTIGTITALVLMISLIGYSIFQLKEIRQQKESLTITNDNLKKDAVKLNSNLNSLQLQNKDLDNLNTQNKKQLLVLNDSINIASLKLFNAKNDLTLAVAKEVAAKKQSVIYDNLSKASYYDINGLPLSSYNYALNAYKLEGDNSTHDVSSLLLSKSLNKGIPVEVNVGSQISDVKLLNKSIICLGTSGNGKSKLTKLNIGGKILKEREGIFQGLATSELRKEIFTCEYVLSDTCFYLDILNENLETIKKVKIAKIKKKSEFDFEREAPMNLTYISEIKLSPSEINIVIGGYAMWADVSNAGYRCRIYIDSELNNQYSEVYTKNDFEGIHEQSAIRFIDDYHALADGRDELFIDDIKAKTRIEIGRHQGKGSRSFIESYDCNPSKELVAMGGCDNRVTILKKLNSRWSFDKTVELPGEALVDKIQFLDDKILSVVRTDFSINTININPSITDLNFLTLYGDTIWKNPLVKSFNGNEGKINSLAYLESKFCIATCSEDKSIRLWSIKDGLGIQLMGSERPVKDIAFDINSNSLVSGGLDEKIRIWNLNFKTDLIADKTKSEFIISDYNWDGIIQDGNQLTARSLRESWGFIDESRLSDNGVYFLQHTYNGKIVLYKNLSVVKTFNTDPLGSFHMTPDFKYVFVRLSRTLKENEEDHSKNAYLFYSTFSADSFYLKCNREILENSFSKTGRWASIKDNKISLHNFDEIKSDTTLADGIISFDSRYFAQSSGDTLTLWNLSQNSKRLFVCQSAINKIEFSPLTKFVIVNTYEGSELISLTDFSIKKINLPNVTSTFTFSSDENLLAIAARYGDFYIYNVNTSESENYSKHGRGIYSLSFSPNSDWIATGSRDRTVRFWNVRTKDFAEYKFLNPVEQVLFSPDGKFLYVNSGIATYVLITPTATDYFTLNQKN